MLLRSVGVHDGSFHADEVTACALLLFCDLVDRNRIVRSRDPSLLCRCEYVCDVGGLYDPEAKRFDHHQASYSGDLSSAGMVWLYLKDKGIVDPAIYDVLNSTFLIGVDAHDNGRAHVEMGTSTFSQVIASFVPPVYDAPKEALDRAFFEAVDFVLGYIKRVLERFRYMQSCKEKVEKSMRAQGRILCFEEAMPWLESFFELGGKEHPAVFVIMPSSGHWKLRGIPPSLEERMKVRVPLPAEWAGLLDEELARASGIPGAIFCHKGRFISVWKTKEDALKAVSQLGV
jgi:uncharacterized UPF0160 family protein